VYEADRVNFMFVNVWREQRINAMFLTVRRGNSGLLTKKFIDLIKQADDGVLDLNKAADTLHVSILPSPSHCISFHWETIML